ncbi:hypothetical protein PVAND_010367 [Polypedilum vanderplanki]|uniref:DNA/RNA non-specific endonuclease domain-containing protein n=1 Tax=Polypedilum vanderplanki TaxID=319348 RepID=A0A9J6CGE4_POLVA|nr:hypothetical protein PVAND_010367 [Polypedilum vanderplanki]
MIINLSYVTANKQWQLESFDQLLKYLSIDDNESRCQFDVSISNKHQPLIIHPNTSKFLHPTDRSGVITIRHNDEIELFCSTGFSHPSTIVGNSVRISCKQSGHFRLNHGRADVSSENFQCRKHPYHSARRRMDERCFNNATIVDIGFNIGNKFLIVMTLCHDESIQTTYYAQYKLTPANIAAQRGIKRPSFIQSDFFPGKDINLLYSREHQRKIFRADILGVDDDDDENEEEEVVYLSRGHLAAKGDFIYGNEQRATFYYINAVPQWQSFNGLNWRAIEDGSRRLAADRNITLNVYTGTYGILSLRDSYGQAQNVYLDMVNKQVPVPKYFYKILFDAKGNSGTVFVCANNVYASKDEINRDYIICNDVSDEIKYINWKRKDTKRGYCYACHVDEFLEKVSHVKGLSVENLLI